MKLKEIGGHPASCFCGIGAAAVWAGLLSVSLVCDASPLRREIFKMILKY
jgi:hypothetical protein